MTASTASCIARTLSNHGQGRSHGQRLRASALTAGGITGPDVMSSPLSLSHSLSRARAPWVLVCQIGIGLAVGILTPTPYMRADMCVQLPDSINYCLSLPCRRLAERRGPAPPTLGNSGGFGAGHCTARTTGQKYRPSHWEQPTILPWEHAPPERSHS
jgi:hypothetical protein